MYIPFAHRIRFTPHIWCTRISATAHSSFCHSIQHAYNARTVPCPQLEHDTCHHSHQRAHVVLSCPVHIMETRKQAPLHPAFQATPQMADIPQTAACPPYPWYGVIGVVPGTVISLTLRSPPALPRTLSHGLPPDRPYPLGPLLPCPLASPRPRPAPQLCHVSRPLLQRLLLLPLQQVQRARSRKLSAARGSRIRDMDRTCRYVLSKLSTVWLPLGDEAQERYSPPPSTTNHTWSCYAIS